MSLTCVVNRLSKSYKKGKTIHVIYSVEDCSLEYIREILCGVSDPSKELEPLSHEVEEKATSLWFNKNLNDFQKEAVMHCLKSKEIAVIHGPPGTGKTTTLVELLVKTAHLFPTVKILCCAPSNIAVDNIAEKLIESDAKVNVVRIGHPARLLESVQNRSLDALVQKADATEIVQDSKKDLHKVLKDLCKERDKSKRYELIAERNQLKKDVRQFEKKAVTEIFTTAQIILCTTTMAGCSKLWKFCQDRPGKTLDMVVIDECAQATEPS